MDLILQLPDPRSRFYTALNKPGNEELYKLIMGDPASGGDHQEDEAKAPPTTPYQHAGLTEQLLMDILDALNRRRAEAMVKGSKKSPKKIKEYPRPQSARDRIINQVSQEELDELAEDLGYEEDL